MKLAFALFTWFPHGGLTRDLIAIARACRRRGHEVRVYAGEYRGARNAIMDAEIKVNILPPAARTNHARQREFVGELKNAIADFAPNLLVGFNRMPAIDVYYAADGCFADKAKRRGWWYRLSPRCRHFLIFENAVFGRQSATEILMIAKNQMRIYQDYYATPNARMTILPPGISRDRIAGANATVRRKHFRAQWKLDINDKLLLTVGSGFRTKGVDRTLRAFAALPELVRKQSQLFVIGIGKIKPYQKLARQLRVNDRVQFLLGRDDVAEFLLGADLLVHPARAENTGTVLLEAMVAGLPVITTDICGYAHYITDEGMGEVLPSPFDQSAFNGGVVRLLESQPTAWRTRGCNFSNTADIYDMPAHACRRIEEIFAAQ